MRLCCTPTHVAAALVAWPGWVYQRRPPPGQGQLGTYDITSKANPINATLIVVRYRVVCVCDWPVLTCPNEGWPNDVCTFYASRSAMYILPSMVLSALSPGPRRHRRLARAANSSWARLTHDQQENE
jgi:hypothetical protein